METGSELYAMSFKNKDHIEKSKICGCFYCLKTFPHTEIKEWLDQKMTALCPFCGIDAVLPDISDERVLFLMNKAYFS